jgi:predicted GIY-YIG superfamily endonuclease
MGRRPDLSNDDLAVWIEKDDEGRIKLNIQKDGEYIGTVKDFDDELGLKENWYVYMIKGRGYGKQNNGKIYYYVGSTWKLKKRFIEHKNGVGSNWFQKRNIKPEKIVYFEKVDTKEKARKREQEVKNWGREKKKEMAAEFLKNNSGFLSSMAENIFPGSSKSVY